VKVVGVVLVFLGMIYLALIEPQLPAFISKSDNRPEFVFEEVVLSFLNEGTLDWELKSKTAVIEDSTTTRLYDIDGQFFSKEQVVVTLKSPIGVLDMTNSDMTLEDARVVFLGHGNPVSLTADMLVFDSDQAIFEGTGRVVIQSGGVQLQGHYFKVDIVNRELTVSANSSARIVQ